MNKNIVKTIREAFKIAYTSKLLKEASEDLAAKLSPEELRLAETIYPRWISGRLRLRFGSKEATPAVQNYLIEKAVEEYKQTGDKKIHDAISYFYYPLARTKTYNAIKMGKYGSAIAQNLRIKFGNNWEDGFQENVLTAWALSLGDPTIFDEIISTYTQDSPTGIGGLLLYKLSEKASSLAAKSKASKKGGGAEKKSLDQPGYDDEGGRKFDIAGGIEINDDVDLKTKLYELFSEFGNLVSDFFESKGKLALATLAKEFFVNGKSYADILSDNPDLFEGKKPGDLSMMMILQVLAPSSVKSISKAVAKEIGFPEEWLENLIVSKNISSIQDAFKEVEPETEAPAPIKKKDEEGLVFEKFINSNMDKIVKEVYKRLGK